MSRAARQISRLPELDANQSYGLDMDVLSHHLGFALNRALSVLRRDFFATLGAVDLRPSMFSVLVLIGANPGVLSTELAQTLELDKASVTNLLKELHRRKWIEAHARHDDLRCKGIYVSPEGARSLGQLKLNVAKHAQKFDAIYTAAEKIQLLELLRRIG